MLISSTRSGSQAANAVTRGDLLGQLNLEAGEEHYPQIDLAITTAQQRLSEYCGRSFGAETWVGYYRDVQPGCAEIAPNGSATSFVLESWDGVAWTAVAGIRTTPGLPPVWHPPATPIPTTPTDGGPNWKATATCAWTVPSAVKQAIILFAAELFASGPGATIPAASLALCDPYRCIINVT